MNSKIKRIVIVGGGTAGWMAATLLSSALRGSNIKITVVESADINSVGVGESTVPSIMDFIQASQIDLKDFIQATSASFKLGIRFDDWLASGENYFHPFGKIGKEVAKIAIGLGMKVLVTDNQIISAPITLDFFNGQKTTFTIETVDKSEVLKNSDIFKIFYF